MAYQMDLDPHPDLEEVYGTYLTTFHSQNGQVIAHLFRQGERVVARVQTTDGRDIDEVTDSYRRELLEFAQENGFGANLRVVLPG